MKKITRSEDFSQWYLQLCQQADLMDYAPVKGCIIFKPYGYALWENIQHHLNNRIKKLGVENAYFPMLIPESFLMKEADHVEGFAPELLTATRVGKEDLEEPYVLRPTSETIIYDSYSRWIQSYRDLPLKINQWANVFRWEKRTRPFLRTSEFLWQEGHTVHSTYQEAEQMTSQALDMYFDFQKEILAFSGIRGKKSLSEQFPGASYTTTIEALAGDGKAIQSCTSHHLGDNFSRAFDIQFMDTDEQKKYAYLTCWGLSTRIIGAMIMIHGDDQGLRLPPYIAPIQVVIVPIGEDTEIIDAVCSMRDQLLALGIRVHVDTSDNRPGFKYAHWEQKGVPLRLEFGKRDKESGSIVVYRRDLQTKQTMRLEDLSSQIPSLLEDIHQTLYTQSQTYLSNHITDVSSFEEFVSVLESKGGFIRVPWSGDAKAEAEIKEKTKATHRCSPFGDKGYEGKQCFFTGKPAIETALFARSY